MTPERWGIITRQVITLLEGGYFHPNMIKDSRAVPGLNLYGKSGETMFGLDRHAGHSIFYSSPRKSSDVLKNMQYIPGYIYRSDAARQFWQLIDNAGAATKWKWNYKGGNLSETLADLAGKIMFEQYKKFSEIYLTPASRAIIDTSPELQFNIAYATWNGSGFFKYYSDIINKAVTNGITNAETINNKVLEARLNSQYPTIKRAGEKMKTYFNSLGFQTFKEKLKTAGTGLAALAAVFFLYVIFKKLK